MRWENLSVEAQAGATLPGYREPATVRTFDAPEAMGIRFYEVLARSGINAVPKRSRMPFRHTINPYRGCAHACTYCLSGETRILMADGTTRRLDEIKPGDAIYGTERHGLYRRYSRTIVLDHWATRKEAYRIQLEDGTEFVASGDHRFLTDRGWKHVTGAECGRNRRARLTANNSLVGTGGFEEGPERTQDYRRGYLAGMIRGDGSIGSYSYPPRPGRSRDEAHRFRLALTDLDALRRTREYLLLSGVATDEFQHQAATARSRPVRAIRSQARDRVQAIRELIRWPRRPDLAWCKGFLAGIFDAEGSFTGGRGGGILRIHNTDPELLEWTMYCLRRLGLPHVLEDRRTPNGLKSIRLKGGLVVQLRFLVAVDPAISRKRSIEGQMVKTFGSLKVASTEPVGRRRLYDISTGSGDFIANGVVSHNCFARPTHTYLDFNAREDFEREIVVKVNVPELVRAELGRPSWKGEHVALGTNTDPYQWVEGRYRLMPGIWEAMRDHANPCSILTKSPLLLRDIELLRAIDERTDFSAALSIPTLDEKAWRQTEPHTPHPRKRMEAVAELTRAGIATSVLIGPMIPGVNDSPEQIAEILELAGEARAANVMGIPLHLRGEVKEIWFDWLREHRPDLIPHYEELYARGAYMKREESRRMRKLVDYQPPVRPADDKPLRGRMRRPARPPGGEGEDAATGARAPSQAALF